MEVQAEGQGCNYMLKLLQMKAVSGKRFNFWSLIHSRRGTYLRLWEIQLDERLKKQLPMNCHVEKAVWGEKGAFEVTWVIPLKLNISNPRPFIQPAMVLRKLQAKTSEGVKKEERGQLQMGTCINSCSEQPVDFGIMFKKWQRNLYSANWTQLSVVELNCEPDPKVHYSWWIWKSTSGYTGDCRCLGAVCPCDSFVRAAKEINEFLSLCIFANRRSRKMCWCSLCYSWEVKIVISLRLITAHKDDFPLETSIKFKWRKKPQVTAQNFRTAWLFLFKEDNLFQRELWSVFKSPSFYYWWGLVLMTANSYLNWWKPWISESPWALCLGALDISKRNLTC